jgi:hypothetical protein
MPKEVENKLKKEAKRKHLSKKRTGAYVYGTMAKLGLMPKKHTHHTDKGY